MSKKFETIAWNFEAEKTLEIFLMENPEIADSIGLSTEQLKKYLEIKLSTKEQEWLKSGEIGIETLKGKLINSSLEKRESQQALKNNQEKYSEIRNITDNEQQISEENAEETIMRELETQSWRQLDWKTEKAIQKVTDIAAKGWDSLSSGVESLKNTWAISAIAWFFLDWFKEVINWFKEIFNTLWNFIEKLMWKFFWKEDILEHSDSVKENSKEYNKAQNLVENHVFEAIEWIDWITLNEEQKVLIKDRLNPNKKDSYLSKEDIKKLALKIQNWEKISFYDLKNLNLINKLYNDNELKNIFKDFIERKKEHYFNHFKEWLLKIWVEINEQNWSEKKLKEIITNIVGTSEIKEVLIENEWKTDWIGGIKIWLDFVLFIPNIIIELYKEDIIKAENLLIWLVEEWKDRVQIWIKSLSGEIVYDEMLSAVSFGFLKDKAWELTPHKKATLLKVLYLEVGLVSNVLWSIWYYSSSWLLSISDKISSAGIENIKSWDIAKIRANINNSPINKLKELLEILRPNEWKWVWELTKSLDITLESYKLLEKINQTNWTEREKLLQELRSKEWELKHIFEKHFSLSVSQLKNRTYSLIQSSYLKWCLLDMQWIVKANIELGSSIINWRLTKPFEQMDILKNNVNLRRIQGNSILHFTKTAKTKEILGALANLSPEIIRTFFWRIPIILITNEMFNELSNKDPDIIKLFTLLNWFFGSYLFLKEVDIKIDTNGIEITNPDKIAWATFASWIEIYVWRKNYEYFVKTNKWVFLKSRALLYATKESIIWLPKETYNLLKWTGARAIESSKFIKSLISKLNKIPIKNITSWVSNRWAYWVVASLIIIWWIIALENIKWSEKEILEELIKKWIINKNWEINTNELWKIFNKLKTKEQAAILELISIGKLEGLFWDHASEFDFSFNEWVFLIKLNENFFNKNHINLIEIERDIINTLYTLDINIPFAIIKE